jgi:hypothetical protein
MIVLILTKEQGEKIRRSTFTQMQKLQLEIQRHCTQFPNELEDTEYTGMLADKLNHEMEIYHAINDALKTPKTLPS